MLLIQSTNAASVVSYTYTLDKAGQVSAAVYNADGRLVRTLLRGEQQEAGDHTVHWDGLDRHGEPQPAGEYTVKLLRTPGFKASFVTQLGVNPRSEPYHKWVGNHGGASSVAVDSKGMFVAAEITETAPVLLKQSPHGKKRLWTQGRGGVTHGRFQGGSALAADKEGMLYMLQQNGRLQPIDAKTGKVQVSKYHRGGKWDPLPEPVKARIDNRKEVRQRYHHGKEIAGADIAAHGDTLVISFREQDVVRWLSKEDGSVEAEIEVPEPLGVAVDPRENVFVISQERVLQVDASKGRRVVVEDTLKAPRRLSIAPDLASFYVAEGPPSHQVKRFNSEGNLEQTYGREGGREEGPYEPTDFLHITDITATGGPENGFIIAEPNVAPRRVAHFTKDGKLVNEYYGGLPYFGVAEPATENPSTVWLNTGSWFTFVDLNYDTGAWEVTETYHVSAMVEGLVEGPGGPRGRWMGLSHNGKTYLTHYHGTAQVLRHGPGTLDPVTITGDQVDTVADMIDGDGRGRVFKWLDANNDGAMQTDEVSFGNGGFLPLTNASFDRITQRSKRLDNGRYAAQVVKQPVDWKKQVPDWKFGSVEVVGTTEQNWEPETTRNRGGGHAWQDSDGNVYAAYSGRGERHGSGWPSIWTGKFRMVKWDAEGNEEWKIGRNATVGGLGGDHGQTPPGQVHIPVGFIGETTEKTQETIVLADRVESPAQAWTRDGLYAGSFFDRRADDGLPDTVYSWWRDQDGNEAITTSDNASAGRVIETPNGRVFWYAQGRNSVPVYEIHGWEDWERKEGKVTLSDQPHAAGNGKGLKGAYYASTDFSGTSITQRTDARIWFGVDRKSGVVDGFRGEGMIDWSNGPEALEKKTEFAVRWTGEIEAQLSEPFTFTTYQRGGVRLWIDGEQRIFGWNEARNSWQTEPIELTAGERVSVQLDYFTTNKHPACSLMWESPTQERERIPSEFLYPAEVEVKTKAGLRPATNPIEAESCDVVHGFNSRPGKAPLDSIGHVIRGLRGRGLGTPGAYVGYHRIDFKDGVSKLRVKASGGPAGDADWVGKLDFRIDAPDGESIGTLILEDKSKPLQEHVTEVADITGVHDLYIVNTSKGSNFHLSLDRFRFE